ncbi:MAG: ABC transporter permease subunit [Armatimonadetes bacterium]|nr:ABC transporter permease subunit [Armatimonadota bacterium]
MRALLRKELGYLAPLGAVLLFCFVADVLYMPAIGPLDEIAWIDIQEEILPGKAEGSGLFLFLIGLTLAYGLLPREHEERTIEFLYSLPVSRFGVYSAKFMAAWLILIGCLVMEQVGYWLLQAANANSLTGHQFSLATALKVMLLKGAVATSGLALGMALSFARHYGLLICAGAAFLIWRGGEAFPPLARVSPLRLASMEYQGRTLVVPWADLGLQAFFAALFFALGYWLWNRSGEHLTAVYMCWTERPLGKAGLGCATVCLIVAGFTALDVHMGEEEEDVRFTTFQNSRLKTGHYDFTYSTEMRSQVLELASAADGVYLALDPWLEAAAERPPIVVDLTSSKENLHGIALREKIVLDLAGIGTEEEARSVLCHETSHVLAGRIGGERLIEYSQQTGLLNEGLAQYLAFERTPVPNHRRDSRRLAVAAWSRHDLAFEDACDYGWLEAEMDTTLEYALGELWVAALVECYGQEAPARLLRAIGRKDGPSDLELMAFWQDSMQAAGFNLERVLLCWERNLAELEGQEQAFLERLPRIAGGLLEDEHGDVVLQARPDRPLGDATCVARFRPYPDAPESMYEVLYADLEEDGSCRFYVPEDLTGDTLEFQLGIEFSLATYPWFERWQPATLP